MITTSLSDRLRCVFRPPPPTGPKPLPGWCYVDVRISHPVFVVLPRSNGQRTMTDEQLTDSTHTIYGLIVNLTRPTAFPRHDSSAGGRTSPQSHVHLRGTHYMNKMSRDSVLVWFYFIYVCGPVQVHLLDPTRRRGVVDCTTVSAQALSTHSLILFHHAPACNNFQERF